ncbi:MAG: hypothetical protein HY070_03350 [Chloroflexi bacterium]|nr:hypothetical protein [Chloroflexota bacterium]
MNTLQLFAHLGQLTWDEILLLLALVLVLIAIAGINFKSDREEETPNKS